MTAPAVPTPAELLRRAAQAIADELADDGSFPQRFKFYGPGVHFPKGYLLWADLSAFQPGASVFALVETAFTADGGIADIGANCRVLTPPIYGPGEALPAGSVLGIGTDVYVVPVGGIATGNVEADVAAGLMVSVTVNLRDRLDALDGGAVIQFAPAQVDAGPAGETGEWDTGFVAGNGAVVNAVTVVAGPANIGAIVQVEVSDNAPEGYYYGETITLEDQGDGNARGRVELPPGAVRYYRVSASNATAEDQFDGLFTISFESTATVTNPDAAIPALRAALEGFFAGFDAALADAVAEAVAPLEARIAALEAAA